MAVQFPDQLSRDRKAEAIKNFLYSWHCEVKKTVSKDILICQSVLRTEKETA